MNNSEMHQGSLANRPRVQYGGGERRRGKRIGGLAQVVAGVPPRESSIDAYKKQQIKGNLATAQTQKDRQKLDRDLRVSQAKANGTFAGIQEKFNKSSTTQVMDENGDISDRSKNEGGGGWFGLAQKAKDILDGMSKLKTPENNTIQARAKGGPVKKGRPYLVGEKGPELVVPAEDGVVIPNEVIEPRRKDEEDRKDKRDGKKTKACAAKQGRKMKDKAAWFAKAAKRWRKAQGGDE